MTEPRPAQYFAEIKASAAMLAGIVAEQDPGLPIPSCPEWTLRQLAAHVGRVHRWAAEIVRTRSAAGIPFNQAPDGTFPDSAAERAAWLTAGADRVVAAIADAGSAHVWAFGSPAPASFWARRQAHETMMHRADAELAVGREVALDPVLAVDGIDEWLTLMAGPRYGRPDARAAALPIGASLRIRSAPSGREDVDGAGDWLVRNTPDGVTVISLTDVPSADGDADATVTGPADRLLLVLVRRLPPGSQAITVSGDAGLLTGWLAGTPF